VSGWWDHLATGLRSHLRCALLLPVAGGTHVHTEKRVAHGVQVERGRILGARSGGARVDRVLQRHVHGEAGPELVRDGRRAQDLQRGGARVLLCNGQADDEAQPA
jgi:hypothetical protein